MHINCDTKIQMEMERLRRENLIIAIKNIGSIKEAAAVASIPFSTMRAIIDGILALHDNRARMVEKAFGLPQEWLDEKRDVVYEPYSRVKECLDERLITLAELASILSKPVSYVLKKHVTVKTINDGTCPELLTLIAEAFSVQYDWLVYGKGEKYAATKLNSNLHEAVCVKTRARRQELFNSLSKSSTWLDRLRVVLKCKGISLTEFCFNNGIGYYYTTGGRANETPTAEMLRKLASLCDVSYEWLKNGSEKQVADLPEGEGEHLVIARINFLLDKASLDEGEVLDRIGMPGAQLYKNVLSPFAVGKMHKIAEEFGVAPSWIYTGKGNNDGVTEITGKPYWVWLETRLKIIGKSKHSLVAEARSSSKGISSFFKGAAREKKFIEGMCAVLEINKDKYYHELLLTVSTVAEKIKIARIRKGVTQKQISDQLGIRVKLQGEMENGQYCNLIALRTLCEYLLLDMVDILRCDDIKVEKPSYRIVESILLSGMSFEEFSEKSGLSAALLRDIKKFRDVSSNVIYKASVALGVSFVYLMCGKEDVKSLSPFLLKSRLERGMTLGDVSKATGVSKDYVSSIERGLSTHGKKFKAVCEFFGVGIESHVQLDGKQAV